MFQIELFEATNWFHYFHTRLKVGSWLISKNTDISDHKQFYIYVRIVMVFVRLIMSRKNLKIM